MPIEMCIGGLGVAAKSGLGRRISLFVVSRFGGSPFGLASSYFSVITPQAGSQNVIFVGSGYLTQRELYRVGLLTTLFFLAVFLVVGTAWIGLTTR